MNRSYSVLRAARYLHDVYDTILTEDDEGAVDRLVGRLRRAGPPMRTQRQWPELWRGHSTAWQVRNIQLSDDVIE